MKYVDKNIRFDDMIKYVDVVVTSSFGKSGRYHKYLRDYSETLALLAMFTDYQVKATNETELLNEMLEIHFSDEWNKILGEIGEMATIFDKYVEDEIETRVRPFAEFNTMINKINNLIDNTNGLIESINVEDLKNFDFDKLFEAVDKLNTAKSEEEEVENTDSTDGQTIHLLK